MPLTPPDKIEEMKTLYYADVTRYAPLLKKYMPAVPQMLVVVYEPEDKSYCILGTDSEFGNWDQYTNYIFKDLQTALEFSDTILRLPDDFQWKKV